MKIRSPWLLKLGGFVAAQTLRHWLAHLDYKAALYDPTLDPAHPECPPRVLYVFWHEYILFPFAVRQHCDVAILLSRHEDARILGYGAKMLGFDCVYGSTSRGGAAALRELLDLGTRKHLCMTPDGPRGPRRRLSSGPIYLASKLQLPLVCMAFGYDRPWRLKSWDRFALPRPFSRARTILSPQISLPADLDRDGLEQYRLEVERMLNRLTCEAEAWAESGTRKFGEITIQQQHAPRRRYDESHSPSGHHFCATRSAALRRAA